MATTQRDITRDLVGKTAVVTGSTSGIGLAIAKEFLARGANVMFTGIFVGKDAAAAHEAFDAELKQLQAQYPQQKMDSFIDDITHPNATDQIMQRAAKLSDDGKIHILVNNAGVQVQKPLDEQTREDWNRVIGANLNGAFYAIQSAIPYMKEAKGGAQIINMASVHGHVVSHDRAPYCASKHGLIALTKVAAMDLAQYNIRSNSVSPAFVKTPLAMKPVEDYAEEYARNNAVSQEAAMNAAIDWRLKNQGGQWIEMNALTQAVSDIAAGKSSLKSGEDCLLDGGYVERANRHGGMAFFSKAVDTALRGINDRWVQISGLQQR